MERDKISSDYTRSQLISMIAHLRGVLYSLLELDSLPADLRHDVTDILQRTAMGTDVGDEVDGGFDNSWF